MMETGKKRNFGIIALSLLIVLLIVYGFWPKPIEVNVQSAVYGNLQTTIEDEGVTRLKDRYVISAPAFGTLQRIYMRPGDVVSAGDPVASITPLSPELLNERQYAMANNRLEAARTTLQQTQENYQLAREEEAYLQKEMERIQNLHAYGIGTDQELERVRIASRRGDMNRISAEFAVRIAEYEVESAIAAIQWPLARTSPLDELILTSPVDGVILNLLDENERPVAAGAPIMEIGDPQLLEIRVDVLSSDAVIIRPGMTVIIKRWGGEDSLTGSVKLVEPSGYTRISILGVEEQRVPVIVDIIHGDNHLHRLQNGYRVVAEFITWSGENLLQIPTSALFRSGDEWAVFTVSQNRARRQSVGIGHQSGLFTEIVSGLNEGDLVITHPDERIEDGVKISVHK
jgi:HlyD family secretion protein